MTENTVNEDVQPETAEQPPSEAAATAGELIEDGDIAIEVDTEAETEAETEASDAPAADDAQAADEVDPVQAQIEALEAKVAELEQAKADTYDRLVRTTADFDNFRKRSRRDVEDAKVDARSRTLKEILPVIDNLERALTHAEGAGEDAAAGILDGVKLVMRQFAQGLARLEVVALEALGKPFDPAVHEAISQMPTNDHPAGSVAAVVQTGYKIGERLLRPAMVVVATALPVEEPVSGGNGEAADMSADDAEAADNAPTTDTAESESVAAADDDSGVDEGGENEAS